MIDGTGQPGFDAAAATGTAAVTGDATTGHATTGDTTTGDAATGQAAVEFDALMAEVMARADRFGHREHVHLTWLAVRRHGPFAAVAFVSEGIRRTARYAGAPQKYHATISEAWVRLVAHHADDGTGDFATFAERYPALLDKRLLRRHYQSATLASSTARERWVEPDLIALPYAD